MTRRRTLLLAGAAMALVLLCGGLGLLAGDSFQSDAYPGATPVAADNHARFAPALVLRRTATYRSGDPLNKIYNWYSRRFGLGPEAYAQSSCILMSRSWTTALVLEQQMSVMVCGTPTDRMMFVMRSAVLRLRG
jgi:hypothetical protein